MCAICKRWQERIQAAGAKNDKQLANILAKMYQAHKADPKYHPARVWMRG